MAISDTDPEARRIQEDLIRDMPTWRRLEIMASLNETSRQLALEGLQVLYPEATDSILKRLLADLQLGPKLAERVYNPKPTIAPASEDKQSD